MKKIRRDDEIVVIAGKDKGKRGKVLAVRADGRDPGSGREHRQEAPEAKPNAEPAWRYR